VILEGFLNDGSEGNKGLKLPDLYVLVFDVYSHKYRRLIEDLKKVYSLILAKPSH
jgi:hypothetical protein